MKEAILSRIRSALQNGAQADHPGTFPHEGPSEKTAVDLFLERFRENGGEAESYESFDEARAWLHEFVKAFTGASVSPLLPPRLLPVLEPMPPKEAFLGVSLARAAAAETGTLFLESREGRLLQLLPPVHLIWVPSDRIFTTLSGALASLRDHPNSVLALHSGPSRSADIGRIMVQGIHGPGRALAAVVPPLPD
jgi:L-lactate dehydrogenase complex protein LldG